MESLGRALYYIVFKDEVSGYRMIYFMRKKSEALEKFKSCMARVEKETGNRIKCLRSDNAKEYLSQDFKDYLREQKVILETSVDYTPQENGTSERENRTLCGLGRAMLRSAELPEMLWAEAIATAAYMMNRVPNRKDKVTPFEQWHGSKPSLDHLRVFGCEAYVWIPPCKRKKLDDTSVPGRLVGHTDSDKIYKIYYPGTRKVDTARDIRFNEPGDTVISDTGCLK